jgi:hypothetical protein
MTVPGLPTGGHDKVVGHEMVAPTDPLQPSELERHATDRRQTVAACLRALAGTVTPQAIEALAQWNELIQPLA